MIPVKLKIKGFLSYRNPVELDFTCFTLACISGPNGAGKSSLLDAITWALFGKARKGDESVINNHPSVEAAEVILDFDYEGNRYRVQRTNPRGKSSFVEFHILSRIEGEPERWKTLSERTLRETDQKIKDALRMDYETFTNASFFLQGKADQFATAAPGERKRILSNILGLEVWESYREAASQRRRTDEKNIKELEGRLGEIQNELNEEPQRKQRLAELQTRLSELEQLRAERAKVLEQARQQHTIIEEQRKMLEALNTQLENAKRDLNRTQELLLERQAEKAGYDQILARSGEIEKAFAVWQTARQELQLMDGLAEQFHQHEKSRTEPQNSIQIEEDRLTQEKRRLEEQKSTLEKAIAGKEDLQARLKVAHKEIEGAEKRLEEKDALELEIKQLQADQANSNAEDRRLKEEMRKLRDRIDRLEAAEETACPLCGQPLSASERADLILDLTGQGESLRDRCYENKALLETYQSSLTEMGARLADLRTAENQLREGNRAADQLENQLSMLAEQVKTWAATGAPRLAEITAALAKGTFAQAAWERIREIDAALEQLGYDVESHERLRQAEQTGRQAEEDRRKLDQARATLKPIEREIDHLTDQKANQEKSVASLTTDYENAVAGVAATEVGLPDLAQAEAALYQIQEQEGLKSIEVGQAMQNVEVLRERKQRKKAFLEEREEITQRTADLKQLERAFGKDGVPALLIEQALPEIGNVTNDLLSRLSNGRMSLTLVTQREYKDANREDKKETLDMIISDSVGVRDYEMFSGGEAFRINFSIRLALSKVLARRAGARLQTLVIDEGFGSQDAQGRQRLVEAINLIRDDFEKVLVITHLDELKEAFPNRIEVEKTLQGSQLQVI